MKRTKLVLSVFHAVLLTGVIANVEAQSLSRQLGSLFGDRGVGLINVGTPVPHDAHFTSDSLATLALLVQEIAPNAADFPAISTTPGFTYRFDPELGVYEEASTSLGSVYVERPQTLGKGKLDVGMTYLYIDFQELNGQDLDTLQFTGLRHNDCCPPRPNTAGSDPAFEQDTADILFQEFNLSSHIVSFFATYGITDNWDANIYIPVVFTNMEVRALARLNNESATDTHFFDDGLTQTTQVNSINDNKLGVGDLLLRTKYRFLNTNRMSMAAGLVLRVPTGSEDDFQGIGDTTVTPFFSYSYELEPLEFHVSSGIDVNTSELDRSRVRYGGGVTLKLTEQLATFADVIGSSSLTTSTTSTTVPQFVNAGLTNSDSTPSDLGVSIADSRTFSRDVRTDIVDLSVGFKANIQGAIVGFAGVIIPLNNDGLRSDLIPSVGLDMSF